MGPTKEADMHMVVAHLGRQAGRQGSSHDSGSDCLLQVVVSAYGPYLTQPTRNSQLAGWIVGEPITGIADSKYISV